VIAVETDARGVSYQKASNQKIEREKFSERSYEIIMSIRREFTTRVYAHVSNVCEDSVFSFQIFSPNILNVGIMHINVGHEFTVFYEDCSYYFLLLSPNSGRLSWRLPYFLSR
jgi:hypothetical protein